MSSDGKRSKKSASASSKRKRQEPTPDSSSDDGDLHDEDSDVLSVSSSYEGDTIFQEWLDEDATITSKGRILHKSFALRVGRDHLQLGVGDIVWMRGGEDPGGDVYYGSPRKSDSHLMIARIEELWEEAVGGSGKSSKSRPAVPGIPMFRARWFFKREDVKALKGVFSGPAGGKDFPKRLTDDDLVMGNHMDDNPVNTICGTMTVVYRQPDADPEVPAMPETTWICRYSMRFGTQKEERGRICVEPYQGENDNWEDFLNQDNENDTSVTNDGDNDDEGTLEDSESALQHSSPSSSDDASEVDETYDAVRHSTTLDEGTTTFPRKARVGPEYQASVPPFQPITRNKIVTRKPTLVWKANTLEESQVDDFFQKAQAILVPYLHENHLVHEEHYSPLEWDRIESFMDDTGRKTLPTLSSIGTAASLTKGKDKMVRECDVDKLYVALHEHKCDVKAALASIQEFPDRYLTAWTLNEKALFDAGFRRYSGSLRMIHKGLGPDSTKDFRDVIDYHYRFKIPDQFRIFQEIKREQAVRMMECIESRRNINGAIVANSSDNNKTPATNLTTRKRKDSDWSRTSIAEVTGAVEGRRVKAKELLLEAKQALGAEKFSEVVDVLKLYHEKSSSDLKPVLMDVLGGYPEFQNRFNEFLPKRHQAT